MNLERNSYVVTRGFRNCFTSSMLLMVAEQVCATVDMALVGNFVSSEAFAALDLALPVESILNGILLLFVGGAGVMASRLIGNQETGSAGKVLSLAAASSVALALLLSVTGLALLDPLVGLLSNDPMLSGYLKSYLRVFFFGLAPMALYASLAEILNVDGKPMVVTVCATAACAVDVVLDVLFMKFMGMGVEGQAYASIASYVLPSIVFIAYIASRRTVYGFAFPHHRLGHVLGRMLKSGAPFFATHAVGCIMLLSANWIVLSRLGTSGLYVWSVGYQVYAFGVMFMSGVGDTVLVTMGGMLAGSRDSDGLGFLLRRCRDVTVAIIGLLVVLVCIFPSAALAIFGGGDAGGADGASGGVRMIALFLIPYCLASLKACVAQTLGRETVASVSFTAISIIAAPAMLLGSFISSGWMFAAVPLSGVALVAADYLLSERVRRTKHPECSRYFMIPKPDRQHTLSISVPYTAAGCDAAVLQTGSFLESAGLDPSLRAEVDSFCKGLVVTLSGRETADMEDGFFDIFIIVDGNSAKVTAKECGLPLDRALQSRLAADASRCSFMYGQNVICKAFGDNPQSVS